MIREIESKGDADAITHTKKHTHREKTQISTPIDTHGTHMRTPYCIHNAIDQQTYLQNILAASVVDVTRQHDISLSYSDLVDVLSDG